MKSRGAKRSGKSGATQPSQVSFPEVRSDEKESAVSRSGVRPGYFYRVLLLMAVTFVAYIPAMQSGFIWNDDTFLTGNSMIKADDGLYRFWATREAPDYWPLTSSTLWVEWRLWGMNASGYHIDCREVKKMEPERHSHHVFCHICPSHCARKIVVEKGEIVSVEPDPESGFASAKCVFDKSQIMKEVRSHPDRLKYPQKRVGKRGEGKWERISWDEALDTIASKILRYKDEFGADSVAFCLGEPKEMEFAFAQRFASAFGTANVVTPGNY